MEVDAARGVGRGAVHLRLDCSRPRFGLRFGLRLSLALGLSFSPGGLGKSHDSARPVFRLSVGGVSFCLGLGFAFCFTLGLGLHAGILCL